MTPVVFLHGWLGCAADFEAVSAHEALAGRPREFIDLPGHGSSALAPTTIKDAVEQLLSAMPHKAHVVGYSMGGRLALALAAAHPERVASLVLIGAHPGLKTDDERAQRAAVDLARATSLRENPSAFLRRWGALDLFGPRTSAAWTGVQQRRLASCAEMTHGWAAALQAFSVAKQEDLWPQLGRTPTLYVAGALDQKYRDVARRLDGRSGVRVALIPDAHHSPHLDQPERTARAIATLLDDPPTPSVASSH